MTLKDVKLDMAENLSEEARKVHNLNSEGLVAIETIGPELRIEIKHINSIREYLLESGGFKEDKTEKKPTCEVCGKEGEFLPTSSERVIYKEGICNDCENIWYMVAKKLGRGL